jgi:hypothetical protein
MLDEAVRLKSNIIVVLQIIEKFINLLKTNKTFCEARRIPHDEDVLI